MGVLRQTNILGQMRLDVPHLRAMEAAVAGDFDALAGRIMAGGRALVVRGFNVVMDAAIGGAAENLEVNVEDAALLHATASEAGTIFTPAASATTERIWSGNEAVSGSWSSGTNYLGLDLIREADSTTTDVVAFIDPNTEEEQYRSVPLARTLKYRFVVSTTPFSQTENILPIAIVTVSSGNVAAVQDARQLLFRLGSGGTLPDSANSYAWPSSRNEETSPTADTFAGGDKSIESLKDWMDAVMSSLWEAKGGVYWYSAGHQGNNRLIRDRSASTGVRSENGQNFYWNGTTLFWKGLSVQFSDSGETGVYQNLISDGSAALAAGECLYVDLDKTQNTSVTPSKGVLSALGNGVRPGNRMILAYRGIDSADGQSNEGSAYAATYAPTATLSLTPTPASVVWSSSPVTRQVSANNPTFTTLTPDNNNVGATSPWKIFATLSCKVDGALVGAPTGVVLGIYKNGSLLNTATASFDKGAALATSDLFQLTVATIAPLTHTDAISIRAHCDGTSMDLEVQTGSFTMERISLT